MRATATILMAELGLAQLHFAEKTPLLGDVTAPESLYRAGEIDNNTKLYRGTIPVPERVVRTIEKFFRRHSAKYRCNLQGDNLEGGETLFTNFSNLSLDVSGLASLLDEQEAASNQPEVE